MLDHVRHVSKPLDSKYWQASRNIFILIIFRDLLLELDLEQFYIVSVEVVSYLPVLRLVGARDIWLLVFLYLIACRV